jgi:hypothetical protein
MNSSSPSSQPQATGLTLLLIAEELKSRRFFNTLLKLGLNDSCYQPHLDEAIFTCLGIRDDSNETFDSYCLIMDSHAEKIGVNKESVEEEAREALARLRNLVAQ